MKNEDFFNRVSEQIAKYNIQGMRAAEQLRSSKDAFKMFLTEFNGDIYDVEHFYVMYLNRANKVIMIKRVSSGGITGTVVDIRIIFRFALISKSTALVLCHNHPSGNLKPSQADIDLTKKVKQAGDVMDIQVVDHVIIGSESDYYSFADEGLI